jgi:hypothetical protein
MVNLEILKTGTWPKQDTGYVEPQSGRRLITRAVFESPVGFATELEIRLNRCSKDIKQTIVDEIERGFIRYQALAGPAREGINYMSGWRRRKETFASYRCGVRFRKREIGFPSSNHAQI